MPRPEDLNDEEALLAGYDPDVHRKTPEEEAEEERVAKEQAEFERRYIADLMRSDMFRRWLMRQLASFGTFNPIFGASPSGFPDPLATWFNAGRRSAGDELWLEVDSIAPEHAAMMRRGQ